MALLCQLVLPPPHILGQITYFNLFNNTALLVAVGVFGKIVRSTDNGTILGNTTSPTANTYYGVGF